jgi:hypothetical protein
VAAAAARGGLPFAPVGVGAPALASATRLIPLPGSDGSDGSGGADGTGDTQAAPARDAAPAREAAAAAPVASATVSQPTEAVPAVANGAGNGVAPPVAPPPSTVAAGAPPSGATPQDPPPAPPPRLTPRPAPPTVAPRRNYGRGGEQKGSRIGKGSFAVAALLLAIIIAAAVLVISHHNSGSSATAGTHHHRGHRAASAGKHSRTTNSPGKKQTKTVRVNPATVTVAVLNGTSTNNLAADVLSKLTDVGFKPGQTDNAPDQTETSTTIGYLPGDRNRALAVARALHLSDKAVVKVPTAAREVVCGTPISCPDQVVVTVGADLESDA